MERPYLPIAIGFYLLALPLFIAVFLAKEAAGAVTNAAAGGTLLALGALVHWRSRKDA